MAISINYLTKVIKVPVDFLTQISSKLYRLDINLLRLALKDLEDNQHGICYEDTHRHNTEITLAGVTFSRTFEIINGYTVEFDDTVENSYTVICVGANHNIADVKVLNSVSLIVGNSAGLITVTSGSGVTNQDKQDIVSGVWNAQTTNHTASGSFGAFIQSKLLTVAKFLGLK
jgi:hypothetical protein